MDVLTFQVGGKWYGLDAGIVHRVVEDYAVYPVPMMPSFYRGLIFYRGDLYDVIDLGVLLGRNPATGSRLMLFRWRHHSMAFLADVIGSMRMLEDRAMDRLVLETGDIVHILPMERWIERIFNSGHGSGEIPADLPSGIG
ncbi:MAG: chemotaxis protein CheW [Thermodesulfobacteriota bacterium]